MAAVDAQLENPAWHALTGEQAKFGDAPIVERARRYQRDVSGFCAVESFDDPASWTDLAEMLGARRAAILARGGSAIEAPEGWEQLFYEETVQYIAVDPPALPDLAVVDLGADDAAEMVALAKLTEPGPFLERTWVLGHYIGVRRDGRLLAMAGERMRGDGWSEISAVCVHPDARRQGLAGALTTKLVHEIQGRGQDAILHVRPENHGGHALYLSIGFERRTEMHFGVWRVPS